MKIILLFVLLLTVSGCTSLYAERVVTVSLAPEIFAIAKDGSWSDINYVSLEIVDKRDWIAPGLSRRWGRMQVGLSRNSFGEQVDPITVLSEPIEGLIKRFLSNQIELQGGHVVDIQCPTLKIELKNIFNDFEVKNLVLVVLKTAVAEFQIVATVRSNSGGAVFTRVISTSARSDVGMMSKEAEAAKNALSSALAQGVQSLLGDPELLAVLRHGQNCEK